MMNESAPSNDMRQLSIDPDGWCSQARRLPSPNFDGRPAGVVPELLVIHNISLPPDQFGGPYVDGLFTNTLDHAVHPYFDQLRPLRVSAHFLIDRNGLVTQFVAANARAWHAGLSTFEGREKCNDFSIGIELEGSDFVPFESVQYDSLVVLTLALRRRYGLRAVAGHEHIAPGRKTDPGPFFDWTRYRQACSGATDVPALRFAMMA